MTDTERLNLIEYYKWWISYSSRFKIFTIHCKFGKVKNKTLREVIDDALAAQIKWSIG